MEDLGIVQLTPKEIAKIPDRLTALPKLQSKELKRRLIEIKQPLNIHSNVSFILIMIGGFILCPEIAYILWQIYRVCSNIKGFKPMVKIFNDKKDDLFKLGDIVTNKLQTLETQVFFTDWTCDTGCFSKNWSCITQHKCSTCTSTKKGFNTYAGYKHYSTSYTGNCEGHRETKV